MSNATIRGYGFVADAEKAYRGSEVPLEERLDRMEQDHAFPNRPLLAQVNALPERKTWIDFAHLPDGTCKLCGGDGWVRTAEEARRQAPVTDCPECNGTGEDQPDVVPTPVEDSPVERYRESDAWTPRDDGQNDMNKCNEPYGITEKPELTLTRTPTTLHLSRAECERLIAWARDESED
jgi:hypothetical protein